MLPVVSDDDGVPVDSLDALGDNGRRPSVESKTTGQDLVIFFLKRSKL